MLSAWRSEVLEAVWKWVRLRNNAVKAETTGRNMWETKWMLDNEDLSIFICLFCYFYFQSVRVASPGRHRHVGSWWHLSQDHSHSGPCLAPYFLLSHEGRQVLWKGKIATITKLSCLCLGEVGRWKTGGTFPWRSALPPGFSSVSQTVSV